MAKELIYTSARKGLKPGTSGFCTVAHTRGLLPSAITLAESLSAYKRPAGYTVNADPEAYSHYRVLLGGESFSLLSRVAFSGKDHTNRDNKIAHHLFLDINERPSAGPAWLAQQELFVHEWKGQPHLIEEPREIPDKTDTARFAETWQKTLGDAGWAGVIAQTYAHDPSSIVYLVFEPGMEMLPLVSEVLTLIPLAKRWLVTFNTYFTNAPAGLNCLWRCCLPDHPLLKDRRSRANNLIINLTEPLGQAPDNAWTRLARGQEDQAGSPDTETLSEQQTQTTDFVRMPNRHRQSLRFRSSDSEGNPQT